MDASKRKKLIIGSILIALMALIGGCHWQHDSDRRYTYTRNDSYREGWRDGRDYERRREGWRDSRYYDRRSSWDYYRGRW
jgi:hypothetical protein